ncbi:MAG TPA: tRNA 2-thiouridine(34) synthase MnmA [Candidatus Cloacimonadota bacterium]|nr:tRNA 2-thiouridine(34) synthase MnmA [Candidatus Cloacimonadota bacterium]
MKKRVLVGLSGGVDSAMTAKILIDQGFDVSGITMSIWDDSVDLKESTKSGCYGPGEKDDLEAAAKVCAELGIPHHIIRLQDEYRDNVLSYFCDTYVSGQTPNPCLICNQRMKFGYLPAKARAMGLDFDYFATGHYARISHNPASGRYELRKAIDPSKDQSYFLSFLRQEQLSNLIFPLGAKTKEEVKALARDLGFEDLAAKQESQDFFESDDYSLLFADGTFQAGEIVDTSGKVLGTHKGLIFYTIGQRRNLGIPGQIEPYYVIRIDAAANRLVVGPQSLLYGEDCTVQNLNWLSIPEPDHEFTASARIRLQHNPAPCTVKRLDSGNWQVLFNEPQLSITPGQGIVFYRDDLVLAGGIIHQTNTKENL